MNYRPELDGLRAVAVLMVMFYHARLEWKGGYAGVDVFFTLSGYLITGIIASKAVNKTFSLRDFWLRRIRRLLPASICMTATTLIAGYFVLWPDEFEKLSVSAIWHQAFLANVYFYHNTNYFGLTSEQMPLLHTWSLSVEEQFYLLFPALLVILFRVCSKRVKEFLFVLGLASFGLGVYGSVWFPIANFYLLPTRAWELLLGACVWLHQAKKDSKQSRTFAECFSFFGLVGVLAAGWLYRPNIAYPGAAALLPTISTAALLFATSGKPTVTGKFLSLTPIVWVGQLSYSLYLWHWPAIVLMRQFFGLDPAHVTKLSTLAIAGGIAVTTYYAIERPIRTAQMLRSSRLLVCASAAAVGVIVLFSIAISRDHGIPSRFTSLALEFKEARNNALFGDKYDIGVAEVVAGRLPVIGASSERIDVVLWGDSHALALATGLDEACTQLNLSGRLATHTGTPPLINAVYQSRFGLNHQAPAFNKAVVEFLRQRQVSVVILAARWSLYHNEPWFEETLRGTVNELSKLNVRVIIVLQVPFYNRDVPTWLATAASNGTNVNSLGLTEELHRAVGGRATKTIRAIAEKHCEILDPAVAFQDDSGLYRVCFDNQSMYCDADHLSIEGSKRLTPLLKSVLSESNVGSQK